MTGWLAPSTKPNGSMLPDGEFGENFFRHAEGPEPWTREGHLQRRWRQPVLDGSRYPGRVRLRTVRGISRGTTRRRQPCGKPGARRLRILDLQQEEPRLVEMAMAEAHQPLNIGIVHVGECQ